MTRTSRFLISLLVLTVTVLVPAIGAPAQASEAAGGGQAGLVGTWMLIFAEGSPAVITFHGDGTVVGTQSPVHPPFGPEPPHVTAVFHSSFQGVWEQTSERQYRMTVLLLEYDQDGELLFIIDVHSRITVSADGNSFTTLDTQILRTPDGTVVFMEEDVPFTRGIRVRLGATVPVPLPPVS